MTFLLWFLLSTPANAKLSTWCARKLYAWGVVADDPHQYDDAPTEWVEREIDRLQIRINWGRASEADLVTFEILQKTLSRHRLFGTL